jgi:hypothetical protein
MAMQDAEVAPTARQVAACAAAAKQLDEVMKRWVALKTTRLSALNTKRKAAGLAPIVVP